MCSFLSFLVNVSSQLQKNILNLTMIFNKLTRTRNFLFATLALATTIQTSYSFVVNNPSFARTLSRSSISSITANVLSNPNDEPSSSDDHGRNPRRAEFEISQDYPKRETSLRKLRIEQEKKNQDTFTPYGNELWDLRSQLDDLSKQLVEVMASGEDERSIREQIRQLEQKDANIVYGLELDRMDEAIDEGRMEDAEEHSKRAMNAKSHLVQFNFEGLWIGKYSDQGFQMINVTYIGDTLVARKVTGDKTVPSGEITFQVDLSPPRHSNSLSKNQVQSLPNLQISERASQKWGNKELQRFKGLGHVASEGFQSSQWLDGQLVLVNEEYFSFSWIPIGVQIFFGRPSPDLQLKMMQEAMEKRVDDHTLEASIDHVARCFEATAEALENGSLDDISDSCIIFDDNIRCFE